MKIVKNYRHDPVLRASFNALAEEVFGLNFENWYQNGFWKENYIPYSVWEDGKVVANVSLNRTDMMIGSVRRRLYQLGTVMTHPDYRGRGYIRALMEQIEKDISDAQGIYLFANDSVLDFYPKFGFQKGIEHEYSKTVSQTGERTMVQMTMCCPEDWARLREAMDQSCVTGACEMVDNPGLIFFYVSQFLQECVFYSRELNAWVIAEADGEELLIHNIFSPEAVSVDAVIRGFGPQVKQVTLGFTPEDRLGWDCRELQEEDCTFFVKDQAFEDFETRKLRIPSLSHA